MVWIRTDYRFESEENATQLTTFFHGESMCNQLISENEIDDDLSCSSKEPEKSEKLEAEIEIEIESPIETVEASASESTVPHSDTEKKYLKECTAIFFQEYC